MYRQNSENSLRNNIDSGDFAAYVEREITGGPSPGQVERPKGVALEASETLNQIKSHPRKSLAGWIVALTSACTFASLGYLALTQGRIVLGGRRGMSTREGLSSDFIGFVARHRANQHLATDSGHALRAFNRLGYGWALGGVRHVVCALVRPVDHSIDATPVESALSWNAFGQEQTLTN